MCIGAGTLAGCSAGNDELDLAIGQPDGNGQNGARADANQEVKWTYKVLDGELKTCQIGTGEGKAVEHEGDSLEIPAVIDGYKVVAIADKALMGATSSYISIPEGVESLGASSFESCPHLTEVMIPNSVTVFGNHAFLNCTAMKYVRYNRWQHTIPTIEENVFESGFQEPRFISAKLYVPWMRSWRFRNVQGWAAFIEQNGISTMSQDDPNETTPNWEYSSFDARIGDYCYNFSPKQQVATLCACSRFVPRAQDESEYYFQQYEGDITVPTTVTFKGTTYQVRSIDSDAFRYSAVTSVTIPDGISIGSRVFANCSKLTRVNFPTGISTIPEGMFKESAGLTSVVIPEGVKTIGEKAFYDCRNLTSVTLNEGLEEIRAKAFYLSEKLESIVVPNSVKTIGNEAFSNSSRLKNITLGTGIKEIGYLAIDCGWNGVVTSLSEHPTNVNEGAFWNCETVTLRVPVGTKEAYMACTGWQNFKHIEEFSSQETNIRSVTIGNK